MIGFSVVHLKGAVSAANAAMTHLEQELNAADSKLGDGDTGGMLARVIGALDNAQLPPDVDVGGAFSAYARAAATATGSSLGTLFATALMTFAHETKGKQIVVWSELGGLMAKALDAMMARGGAKLGDKTVLDALDAVSRSIEGLDNRDDLSTRALAASRSILEEYRQRPNKIGRARMFAEATIGLDDPGMLAFTRLTEALVQDPV